MRCGKGTGGADGEREALGAGNHAETETVLKVGDALRIGQRQSIGKKDCMSCYNSSLSVEVRKYGCGERVDDE